MLVRSLAPAFVVSVLLAGCNGGSVTLPRSGTQQTSLACATSQQAFPPVVKLTTLDGDPKKGCEAFDAHAIVVGLNVNDAVVASDLELPTQGGGAVAQATVTQGASFAAGSPTPNPTFSPMSFGSMVATEKAAVIAYHFNPSGETSMFHAFGEPATLANAELTQWIAGQEAATAAAERARPLSEPGVGSWIPMIDDTISSRDGAGNYATTLNSYYKLYEHNFTYDYFMVTSKTGGAPNYKTCNVSAFASGQVGWFMNQRSPSADQLYQGREPSLRVYDHGPLNVPGSQTASFTIGTSLNASGPPSVTAVYMQSWSQPDVNTIDQTGKFGDVTALWEQHFAGWNFVFPTYSVVCPPVTSNGTFTSPQAAIYQVAEAKSPTLQSSTPYSFEYDNTVGQAVAIDVRPTFATTVVGDGWVINVPFLQICTDLATGQCAGPYNYSLPVNHTLPLDIYFKNFSYAPSPPFNATPSLFEPAWTITNVPAWLNVSQLNGVGITRIILTPQPGTAPGSVATLNVNTNPPGGTPELEHGPLVVTIRAVAAQ